MKIKIDKNQIKELSELKESIDNLLSLYDEEVEFTEEKLFKIEEAISDVRSKMIRVNKAKLKIISSTGKELIIL